MSPSDPDKNRTLEFRLQQIPMISDAEQAEIEAELGTPADLETEEFIDLTEWTENGGQPL